MLAQTVQGLPGGLRKISGYLNRHVTNPMSASATPAFPGHVSEFRTCPQVQACQEYSPYSSLVTMSVSRLTFKIRRTGLQEGQPLHPSQEM